MGTLTNWEFWLVAIASGFVSQLLYQWLLKPAFLNWRKRVAEREETRAKIARDAYLTTSRWQSYHVAAVIRAKGPYPDNFLHRQFCWFGDDEKAVVQLAIKDADEAFTRCEVRVENEVRQKLYAEHQEKMAELDRKIAAHDKRYGTT